MINNLGQIVNLKSPNQKYYSYLATFLKLMDKFTTYPEVIQYLYTQLPMFQRVGAVAYRKDLKNTLELCKFLNFPQHRFKSIHIAGTNGKGSSSHMLASVLQEAGFKTGLYTSPHLVDFTERIRIDGIPIDPAFVIGFVNRIRSMIDTLAPSFFEITVAMAFEYFAAKQVDIAVIEVGMGGRLDSTNVILPEVSLITNISDDHKQWLGDTLEKIAGEKAGIIKQHVPVVISEEQPALKPVFDKRAHEHEANIHYAFETYKMDQAGDKIRACKTNGDCLEFSAGLGGAYQLNNYPGVLKTLEIMETRGFVIGNEHILKGLENVVSNTGLKGRWQVLQQKPLVICDVGHNLAGVQSIVGQIQNTPHEKLYMVWGMVEDKEMDHILCLLPKEAYFYFCQAKIPRAKSAQALMQASATHGLKGTVVEDVNEALDAAIKSADEKDLVFIGGSTFVVAELNGL